MKITIILQICLSSALMFVCAPALSLSAEATALQEIKIGYTSQSISAFPIEFARRKGFFRAEGLNFLMIVMRTNVIMTALVTRGIDYGTPATSVIRGAASDLPIKAVAVLTGRPDYFLAAKKEFSLSEVSKGSELRSALLAPLPTSLFEWCFAKKGWTRSET
jgi:ABC-type nitrate/sulfonate/bicarbonate transport system substrate-binding protein